MAEQLENSLACKVTNLANLLISHVIPLFAVPKGKRPSLVGTALLVTDGTALFAISAKHVLDQAIPPGRLYFYDKTKVLRQLSGRMVRSAPLSNQTTPDSYDIAVMRLPADTPDTFLEALKNPAPMRILRPFRTNRVDHQYLVTGFPRSKSRADPSTKQLKSQPQAFRVVSATEEAYDRLGLTQTQHIVMPLNIESMWFPDGTQQRIADPHGMSGSPVWLLYDERLPNDPEETPVIGIAIEYHKTERLLVATDIGVALELIQHITA